MPRSSNVTDGLPLKARRQLESLGREVARARKERGLSQENLAQRMFVSRQTLHRLETGDPAVSMAAFAAALFALGLSGRLDRLAAGDRDDRIGRQRQSLGGGDDLDF
jgi:transcriptional regulator with XRE-family HTH domain